MSAAAVPTVRDVREALRAVLDPELDASIVDLGFVAGIALQGSRARIELRLPTFWCAPNFSWLMAEDARQAVLRVPGIEQVSVTLLEHHVGEEVSAGVSGGRSFAETFAGEATDDLEDLRRLFRRKAFFRRQERLLSGLPPDRVTRDLRLRDLPTTPEAEAYVAIRAELGLDCSPDAPALTDARGRPVDDVARHLQRIRLTRVSMDANTALCRGLLEARYAAESAP